MLYTILLSDNLTPQEAVAYFLISTIVFFISLALRELMRGVVATKLGDPTPKLAGRVTINPIKHLDPIGFFSFMLIGVGWAKPMPINPLNFKKYRKGTRLIALTGILTNFILGLIAAIICAIIYATVGIANDFVFYLVFTLQMFMLVNSCLVMFNLLPLYPEDCFMFLTTFMKTENKFIKFNIKYGFTIFFSLIMISIIIEMLFGIDILAFYLRLISTFVYSPITFLGVV